MNFTERYASHVRLALLLSLVEGPRDADLRLCILRLLAGAPAGTATISLIKDALEDFGHRLTRDEVAAVIAWLVRARLVTPAPGDVPGAMVLDLGRDVAEGRVQVPDVAVLPTLSWLVDKLVSVALPVSVADLGIHVEFLTSHDCVVMAGDALLITAKGRDVASGRDRLEGVKTPSATTIMTLASNAARDRLGG